MAYLFNPDGANTDGGFYRRVRAIPEGTLVNVNAVEKDPINAKRITWPIDWRKLSPDEASHLLATEEIPPVLPSFRDPDDSSTWEDYKEYPHQFLLRPFPPRKAGEKILSEPMFELYSIKIIDLGEKMRKSFKRIVIQSMSTDYIPVVIYKRPPPDDDDDDVDLTGQPLPLTGPARLPIAQCNVIICLNLSSYQGWQFEFDADGVNTGGRIQYDEPLYHVCEDAYADSKAQISYEIIKKAVRADLEFHFIPPPPTSTTQQEQEQRIKFLRGGTIYATNDGKLDTKRIVKQLFHQVRPVAVPKTNKLPVDRFVFAVPKRSKLHVTAENLVCEDSTGYFFQINGTLHFDVPKHSCSEERSFPGPVGMPELRLTVSWSHAFC